MFEAKRGSPASTSSPPQKSKFPHHRLPALPAATDPNRTRARARNRARAQRSGARNRNRSPRHPSAVDSATPSIDDQSLAADNRTIASSSMLVSITITSTVAPRLSTSTTRDRQDGSNPRNRQGPKSTEESSIDREIDRDRVLHEICFPVITASHPESIRTYRDVERRDKAELAVIRNAKRKMLHRMLGGA